MMIYVVESASPPGFSSLKQKLPFTRAVSGSGLVHLFVKPKGTPTLNLLAFARLQRDDEPERYSQKPRSHDEIVSSSFQDSQFHRKDSHVEYVKSAPNSEVKDLNHVPFPSLEAFGDPENVQQDLLDKVKAVHLHVLALEQWNSSRLKTCHRNYVVSATNLIHYLALQCLDLQQLKEELTSIGLLNLEIINSHVLASITAAIHMLENLTAYSPNMKVVHGSTEKINVLDGRGGTATHETSAHKIKGEYTINRMRRKVSSHAESLFGSLPNGRPAHIMVTVGKEATHSNTLIHDLLKAGANVVRINCAHDDPSVWSEIIKQVKNSSQKLEKSCRILMDLAGPKLRTGNLEAGPNVMKISPKKNPMGDMICPARVWLSCAGSGPPPAHISPDAIMFLDDSRFLGKLEAGDVVRFFDVRGKRQELKVLQKVPVFSGFGCMTECSRTAFVESGTELYIKEKKRKHTLGLVVGVPAVEQFIRLRVGDLLLISRDPCLLSEKSGNSEIDAHRITCSSSHLFDAVKPGEPIAFDDGRIWGVIQGASLSEIVVSITHAGPKGSKLGSEKSINIPRSEMQFEGLTSKDLVDLEFVAANADMVGVSFIRDVRDVVIIQQELEKRKLKKLGIILKIETQSGFEKLPLLLLQAMQSPNPLGVMIARGDLAVECGWERLADMQEEILSICNAAHVPVIWATQVLESLVKSGLPTRPEITDVAHGMRASCIMLNKGKCIVEAVSTLESIMRKNSAKKMINSELKPLVLSSNLSQ